LRGRRNDAARRDAAPTVFQWWGWRTRRDVTKNVGSARTSRTVSVNESQLRPFDGVDVQARRSSQPMVGAMSRSFQIFFRRPRSLTPLRWRNVYYISVQWISHGMQNLRCLARANTVRPQTYRCRQGSVSWATSGAAFEAKVWPSRPMRSLHELLLNEKKGAKPQRGSTPLGGATPLARGRVGSWRV
jgi:hypothetical protein